MKSCNILGINSKSNYKILCICILLFIGALMRIVLCWWGYPYPLHPDEYSVIDPTIDMITRHSYEPDVYHKPQHFIIKCCAILFQIVSNIKYHANAHIGFLEHRIIFHVIARLYTAFFGVLMIWLTYKFVEKIKPQASIIAAGLVAFFPIFVTHSAYATPDIVLTFFVLLVTYLSILYLENPSTKYLTLMCIASGIGITVKYPCAITCIWIAIVVCVNHIKKRQYSDIVKDAIFSAVVVFAVCFFVAPNLFTNMSKTIASLRLEARSIHPGADGLNFWGNFKFYLTTFLMSAGYETLICMLAGVLFCLKNRNNIYIYIYIYIRSL